MAYVFGPHYPTRLELIEQLLNNAINYYEIIMQHGKPAQELIVAYDQEYRDVLKTLSTDRYLTSPLSDVEQTGLDELAKKQELIEAKIKFLKSKKQW